MTLGVTPLEEVLYITYDLAVIFLGDSKGLLELRERMLLSHIFFLKESSAL